MADSDQDIAGDLRAVSRLNAVPTLLQVLCDTTGMGFAAVARVTDDRWVACAVQDGIDFGLKPGGELPVKTTLCLESRALRAPIVIDHASYDPIYQGHHTAITYKIESYVSVPIIFPKGGRYFGNLCAIDPKPARVSDPKIISMFQRFAQLIAFQLEDELSREQEQSVMRDERAANELREQFIAILGHDLRNPLQAVYMSSLVLEKKLTDPGLLDIATRIRNNTRRMSALIDDVLDFARGRLGGGIGIQIEQRINIGENLGSVVRELQDANPERQVLADINVNRPVMCDIGRLQQLASNLIGNALTHGSKHSPVKVSAHTEGDDFLLHVWNDGDPIPPESIGKIFQPFWRPSTSGHREGLGLGLHICSQIVSAHHGSLSVQSDANSGTRFTVRLPLN